MNLSEGSKKAYQSALRPMIEKYGSGIVVALQSEQAEKIITMIGRDRPAMANMTRKVLARVFEYAIKPLKIRRDNPFVGIDAYHVGEHATWSEKEIAQFEARWAPGTHERTCFATLLSSGQRVSDVATMKRTDIKAGNYIHVKQQKTGAELDIPMHPAWLEAIKAGPTHVSHLCCDHRGKPFPIPDGASPALSKFMAKAIEAAGLPDTCVPHGLRKAACRRLAEAGASVNEIASISGHRSLAEIKRYTDAADQVKLANSAIGRLEQKGPRSSA